MYSSNLSAKREKHASMDFHVKTMSSGSDPKRINHFLFFFFFSFEGLNNTSEDAPVKISSIFSCFFDACIENYYFLFFLKLKINLNYFDSLVAKNISNLRERTDIVVVYKILHGNWYTIKYINIKVHWI